MKYCGLAYDDKAFKIDGPAFAYSLMVDAKLKEDRCESRFIKCITPIIEKTAVIMVENGLLK